MAADYTGHRPSIPHDLLTSRKHASSSCRTKIAESNDDAASAKHFRLDIEDPSGYDKPRKRQIWPMRLLFAMGVLHRAPQCHVLKLFLATSFAPFLTCNMSNFVAFIEQSFSPTGPPRYCIRLCTRASRILHCSIASADITSAVTKTSCDGRTLTITGRRATVSCCQTTQFGGSGASFWFAAREDSTARGIDNDQDRCRMYFGKSLNSLACIAAFPIEIYSYGVLSVVRFTRTSKRTRR